MEHDNSLKLYLNDEVDVIKFYRGILLETFLLKLEK